MVSVSRTPGHTKKWQTHFVRREKDTWDGLPCVDICFPAADDESEVVVAQLCDSPGLIFPVAWVNGSNNNHNSMNNSIEMKSKMLRFPNSSINFDLIRSPASVV